MKKCLCAFALLCLSGAVFADPPAGWPGRYSVVGGTEVWTQPTGPITSPTEATFAAATGGGVTATSLIAPILADGRAVALTAYRAVTGSALLQAAGKVISAGTSPAVVLSAAAVGILAAKLPAFLDWIAGDGGQHVRIGPVTGQLEKKAPDQTQYQYTVWGTNVCTRASLVDALSCAEPGANFVYHDNGYMNAYGNTGFYEAWHYVNGTNTHYTNLDYQRTTTGTLPGGWLPASLDDIAPYMTARPPPSTYPVQILSAGVPLDAAPVSMSGPTSLPEPAPQVQTVQYPKQQDQTSTTVASGNPFNLPDNQPVDQVSTESIMTGPGSKSVNGPPILGYEGLAPQPLSVPVTKTATSTFNPTTNQTTTVTHTVPHGAVQTKTCTPTTALTSTATTSTVSKTVTCVTTTIDSVTGQTLANSDTVTETSTTAAPVTQATDCEKSPTNVGCAALGQAPPADPLLKTAFPVSITSITFAGTSSCPQPLSFNVRTGSYAFSYQPLCDKLAVLRGLFLAIAGVIAAYVVITAFKV